MNKPWKSVLSALSVSALLPVALAGQLPEIAPADSTRLEVAVARPWLSDSYSDLGLLSASMGARFFVPMRSGGAFFVEAGLSHARSKSAVYAPGLSSETLTSLTLSNVSVGVVSGSQRETWGAFTATLPTTRSWGDGYGSAAMVGVLSDLHHLERFMDEAVTVNGTVGRTHATVTGASVGGWGTAGVIIPTQGGGDSELIARYGFFASTPGSVRVRGEINGWMWVSGSGSFGDRSDHFVGASVALADRASEPEFFLRVPLQEHTREDLKAVTGFRFRF